MAKVQRLSIFSQSYRNICPSVKTCSCRFSQYAALECREYAHACPVCVHSSWVQLKLLDSNVALNIRRCVFLSCLIRIFIVDLWLL